MEQIVTMFSVLFRHFADFAKMSTFDCQWVIKNPEKAISLFLDVIKNYKKEVPSKFLVTVKIGQYKNMEKFLEFFKIARKNFGLHVTDHANEILSKIPLSGAEEEVDLYIVRVSNLLFYKKTKAKTVFKRVFDLGYDPCSAEAIVLASVQCGSESFATMEPIACSDGSLRVLSLEDVHGADFLSTKCVEPNTLLHLSDGLIVARFRRK